MDGKLLHLSVQVEQAPSRNIHEELVGAQPPPYCSFARHLVGKITIFCSFAHH